jgi:hypothetical protein
MIKIPALFGLAAGTIGFTFFGVAKVEHMPSLLARSSLWVVNSIGGGHGGFLVVSVLALACACIGALLGLCIAAILRCRSHKYAA